jgi:hypothetical protein
MPSVFFIWGALAGGRIDRGDAKLQEAIFEETVLDVTSQRVPLLRKISARVTGVDTENRCSGSRVYRIPTT